MYVELWYAISGLGVCVGCYLLGRKLWRWIHEPLNPLKPLENEWNEPLMAI
jgi:hypothetical protein